MRQGRAPGGTGDLAAEQAVACRNLGASDALFVQSCSLAAAAIPRFRPTKLRSVFGWGFFDRSRHVKRRDAERVERTNLAATNSPRTRAAAPASRTGPPNHATNLRSEPCCRRPRSRLEHCRRRGSRAIAPDRRNHLRAGRAAHSRSRGWRYRARPGGSAHPWRSPSGVEPQAFATAVPARAGGVGVGVAGKLALGLRRRLRQCGLAHAVAPALHGRGFPSTQTRTRPCSGRALFICVCRH
jgi:hypothetical protein